MEMVGMEYVFYVLQSIWEDLILQLTFRGNPLFDEVGLLCILISNSGDEYDAMIVLKYLFDKCKWDFIIEIEIFEYYDKRIESIDVGMLIGWVGWELFCNWNGSDVSHISNELNTHL